MFFDQSVMGPCRTQVKAVTEITAVTVEERFPFGPEFRRRQFVVVKILIVVKRGKIADKRFFRCIVPEFFMPVNISRPFPGSISPFDGGKTAALEFPAGGGGFPGTVSVIWL